MNCKEYKDAMLRYIDGTGSEESLFYLESHTKDCE